MREFPKIIFAFVTAEVKNTYPCHSTHTRGDTENQQVFEENIDF